MRHAAQPNSRRDVGCPWAGRRQRWWRLLLGLLACCRGSLQGCCPLACCRAGHCQARAICCCAGRCQAAVLGHQATSRSRLLLIRGRSCFRPSGCGCGLGQRCLQTAESKKGSKKQQASANGVGSMHESKGRSTCGRAFTSPAQHANTTASSKGDTAEEASGTGAQPLVAPHPLPHSCTSPRCLAGLASRLARLP